MSSHNVDIVQFLCKQNIGITRTVCFKTFQLASLQMALGSCPFKSKG